MYKNIIKCETSLFPVIENNSLYMHSISLDQIEFDNVQLSETLVNQFLRKQTLQYFQQIQNIYFFSETQIQQPISINIQDQNISLEIKEVTEIDKCQQLYIFLTLVIEKDKNFFKFAENKYLVPFEKFQKVQDKIQTSRFYIPYFSFDIAQSEQIKYLNLQVNFFVQKYHSLKQYIQGYQNFDQKQLDNKYINIAGNRQFEIIRLRDMKYYINESKSFISFSYNHKQYNLKTDELNLWKIEKNQMSLEKINLYQNIKRIIEKRTSIKKAGIQISKKSFAPNFKHFSDQKIVKHFCPVLQFDPFQSWTFFCYQENLNIATNFVQVLINSLKTRFYTLNINNPSCFFIDKNDDIKTVVFQKFTQQRFGSVVILLPFRMNKIEKRNLQNVLKSQLGVNYMILTTHDIQDNKKVEQDIEKMSFQINSKFQGDFRISFDQSFSMVFINFRKIDQQKYADIKLIQVSKMMETSEYNIQIDEENQIVEKLRKIQKHAKNFIIFTSKEDPNSQLIELLQKDQWIIGRVQDSKIKLFPSIYIPSSSLNYKIDINNYKEHLLRERNAQKPLFYYYFFDNKLFVQNSFKQKVIQFYDVLNTDSNYYYQIMVNLLHLIQVCRKDFSHYFNQLQCQKQTKRKKQLMKQMNRKNNQTNQQVRLLTQI